MGEGVVHLPGAARRRGVVIIAFRVAGEVGWERVESVSRWRVFWGCASFAFVTGSSMIDYSFANWFRRVEFRRGRLLLLIRRDGGGEFVFDLRDSLKLSFELVIDLGLFDHAVPLIFFDSFFLMVLFFRLVLEVLWFLSLPFFVISITSRILFPIGIDPLLFFRQYGVGALPPSVDLFWFVRSLFAHPMYVQAGPGDSEHSTRRRNYIHRGREI